MGVPLKKLGEEEEMKMRKLLPGLLLFFMFLLCSALAVCFLWKGTEVPKEPVLFGMVDITVDKGDKLPDLKEDLTMNEAVETLSLIHI